jgi:hypothetical protein
MNKVEALKARIALLESRNRDNGKIVNKLKLQIRALEAKA